MKIILRILLFLILITTLVIASVVGYVYFNSTEIKQQLLAALNKQLKTDIQVSQIGLDFWHTFPSVSLDLQKVIVNDAFKSKTPLLQARNVYIGFNVWDVFQKHYTFHEIRIDSAQVKILILKNGKANYAITQNTNADSNTSQSWVNLQKIRFTRTALSYTDLPNDNRIKAQLEDADCAFEWNESATHFKIKTTAFVDDYKNGATHWIKEKPIKLASVLHYHYGQHTLEVEESNLAIGRVIWVFSGDAVFNKGITKYQLAFQCAPSTITELSSLLPAKFALDKSWKADGKISFDGKISGESGKKNKFDFRSSLSIRDGLLERKDASIEHISAKGEVVWNEKNSKLSLTDLSFKMKNTDCTGSFEMSNFSNPYLSGNFSISADAIDIAHLFQDSHIRSVEGKVNAKTEFKGYVKDMTDKRWLDKINWIGNVDMTLQNLVFDNNGSPIKSINFSSEFKPNGIDITSLDILTGESDLHFAGNIKHIFSYLFFNGNAASELSLTSKHFKTEDILQMLAGVSVKNDTAQKSVSGGNMYADIKAQLTHFYYKKIEASNVELNISATPHEWIFSELNGHFFNGQISCKGSLQQATDGRKLLTINGKCANADIKQLFSQCENFGQTELTDKHLQGTLNTTFQVYTVINKNGEYDVSKLFTEADIRIDNGGINQYEPLQKLSKYARVEDLKNLRFQSLHNTITISSGIITIPEMLIQNNALNLTLSGTHAFTNDVNYKIKLKLSDVLWKKRKQKQTEFEEEEEDANNGMQLFLSIKGPIDNPDISYDRIGVKNKVKQDLHAEKENIKQALQKELGLLKDSTIKEKNNDSEELEFEKE